MSVNSFSNYFDNSNRSAYFQNTTTSPKPSAFKGMCRMALWGSSFALAAIAIGWTISWYADATEKPSLSAPPLARISSSETSLSQDIGLVAATSVSTLTLLGAAIRNFRDTEERLMERLLPKEDDDFLCETDDFDRDLDEKHKQIELRESLNFLNRPGTHTIDSPVAGSRANEMNALKEAMRSEKIFGDLENAIYNDDKDSYKIIKKDKKDEADSFSKDLFLEYISKYENHGCTEENIVDWTCNSFRKGVTFIYDQENDFNTWRVHAIVEMRHPCDNKKKDEEFNELDGYYLPPHIVAYHELMHVEETLKRASVETQKHEGRELLTTIKTIILLDVVYKRIHKLEENSEVDYGKFVNINGKQIKLGSFANFYREEENKKGNLSAALISPESIKFLKKDNDN